MSHEVEKMMYFGQVPWHGLGTRVSEDILYDIDACIEKSGLDWESELHELMTVGAAEHARQNNLPMQATTNHRAVVRSTDKKVLGVVGPRYNPLHNRQAFEWFKPFLESKECAIHTAGSLYGGAKVWVLAQINRDNSVIAKNDEIAKFVLLSNSHDGTTAVRVGFTPIRVVCANTMAFAHGSAASQLLRVRHSSQLHVNLDRIRDIMDMANQEFEATADQFRFLASRHINPKDLQAYVKVCLGLEKVEEKDIKTRTRNIMDDITRLILQGKNQTIPGVGGTWWAAYNGVNEYLNYGQGRSNNTRLGSLWFGRGVTENRKALETALKMAN